MTTVIKNGTIVTADLTYKADVKIEDGKITEVDCCYGSCVYQGNCPVAREIEALQ